MSRRSTSGDEGSLLVELVVLTPVLFVVAVIMVAFGRVAEAHQQVTEASRAAAEAAAVLPDAQGAQQGAASEAQLAVSGSSLTCSHLQVSTDVSHFSPGGYVGVTVSCRVSLADLAVPGLPGSTTIRASSVAPIDPYRSVR